MKRIFAMLVLLAPVCCPGQITIDSSGYPASVLGTDSLKITTTASAFPVLSPLAGGTWDLSIVTDSTPTFFAYRVHGTGYQFADSDLFHVGLFAYQGNIQSNISASEVNEYRTNVHQKTFSLYPFTANPDSLVIDSQTVVYSSAHKKILLPCTYNSAWSSNYHSDLGIHLTYLVGGDTSAPGIVRTYTTEKDSVTGWGKMRIRDVSGMPSNYLNVLQVQTRIIRTDSFFLKGVPFSGSLLSILGVTQGQRDTLYEQNYYRVGELTPLAQVEFRDAGYTQPYKATTHVQRLSTVGVSTLTQDEQITIYPNPLTGSVLIVELPQHGSNWSYRIIDMAGHCVAESLLQKSGSRYVATIPTGVTRGLYVVQVKGEAGTAFSRLIEIR